jgi:hypothetical protein
MIPPRACGAKTLRAPDRVSILAHVPVSLDLSSVLRLQLHAYALWTVSAVVIRRFTRRVTATEFVPLAVEYVLKHLPRKVYKEVLDALVGHDVLECDGRAWHRTPGVHGKCRYYRLGPKYRGEPIRAVRLTHAELMRKMNRYTREERDAITDPVHRRLRDWHDRVEVLPSAPCGAHPLLDRMIDGERRFCVCPMGRCHTNITNLPREYRQYVRLAGHELASVDVSAAQPILLGLYVGDAGARSGPREPAVRGSASTQRTSRNRPAEGGTLLVYPSSNHNLTNYLADCLSGSLYEKLSDLTGYPRDVVKRRFLAVVYGEERHMNTKVGESFHRLYPTVFDAVIEANYRLGHGGLPCEMQRLESRVMIGGVAARFLRENLSTPVLTLHDCLLVPPSHTKVAEEIIRSEWQSSFGVAPRLKVTMFTDPQEPRRET